MADYHPLIARAVAGLDKNTSEARRSLYERARAALVDQLRSATPALNESDITRERLALEEAIRKVEAEEARRGRRERPQPASSPPPAPIQAAPPEQNERSPAAQPEPSPSEPRDHALASASDGSMSRGAMSPIAWSPMAPLTVETFPAIKGKAVTAAQQQVPLQQDSKDQVCGGNKVPFSAVRAPDSMVEPAHSDAVVEGAESARLEAALRKLRGRFTTGKKSDPAPSVVPSREDGTQEREAVESEKLVGEPAVHPETMDAVSKFDEHHPDQPLHDQAPPDQARRRFSGIAVKVVIAIVVLAVLAALGAVGYRERGSLVALYHLFSGPPAPVTREEVKTQPKIEDRIGSAQPDRLPGAGQSSVTGPATQPPPAVAQRVVLYEEDQTNPAGKRYVGSAIWRTETVSPGPGLAPELAVKANIEIPERRMTMTFSMVRNTDPTLPASHTVDIRFKLPPDFHGGGIANVPGLLMKQAEQTRGVPLAGIAVKVTNNVFLIGLSSVESDVQRNTQLLRERTWFDIPIVYSNGSRAILAMEKGTPGERAFNDAFTAWGSSGTAAR